ncbi:MAG: hypothetical protein ACLTT1_05990 [[Clostridium] scindens]
MQRKTWLPSAFPHRVEQILADRAEGWRKSVDARPFERPGAFAGSHRRFGGHSAASARVQKEYQNMLRRLGPEFDILRTMPLEEIRSVSGYLISEGIGRLREGKAERIPGFDGGIRDYKIIRSFRNRKYQRPDGLL